MSKLCLWNFWLLISFLSDLLSILLNKLLNNLASFYKFIWLILNFKILIFVE